MKLQELFDKCYRDHWDTARYCNSGWAKEVRGYFDRHLRGEWVNTPISKIDRFAIKRWHAKLDTTPIAANRCLEILCRLFNYAIEIKALTVNEAEFVKPFPERIRERYASEEELKRIGKYLKEKAVTHPIHTAFVYLLALTGARPRSLMRVARHELSMDGEHGILRFEGKMTKTTGRQEVVVIPPEAMREIVAKLPIREDGLLLGPVKYRSFWDVLRRETECPKLWLRDLRRTFATVGLSNGVSLDSIGDLLNHKSRQTTLRYAKLTSPAKIAASHAIAQKMSELLQ